MKDIQRRSPAYQVMLVLLLSLNFGILFFDRNAANFLMPYVQPDLQLSNTQVGLLASGLSLTWAVAAFLVGSYADRTGRRKSLLIASGLLFSVCSVLSGLAGTFAALLGARLLMGLAEGGNMPISHAIVAGEVTPTRRGLANGVTQNLGSNLLGSTVAPLVLVPLAIHFGWRHAFFLAAAPGLIATALVWLLVKPPLVAPVGRPKGAGTLREVLRDRNVVICALMSVLLVGYLVICWGFMPLFLTKVRGFDGQTMAWLMATLGIAATVGSFLTPAISDAIGRRKVMIPAPFIGVILPLGAMYWHGPVFVLAGLFFVGWTLNGIFPMFMATVPSESVDPRLVVTAMGLSMGLGEALGGVFGPLGAGWIADRTSLAAPLWCMVVLCVTAGILALGLRETAPRVLGKARAEAG